MARFTTLGLSLLVACTMIGCDDEGKSTTCEEMPILAPAGQAGQSNEAEFDRWYDEAQREGCATAPGDPEDFTDDEVPPGAAGAGN